MNRKLVIFTDIGDTIIDEGTEERDEGRNVVLRAECIPGAKEAMIRLYEAGYPICMVADGLMESFTNTMAYNGMEHIFKARSISEEFNTHKPAPIMFQKAMERMGLTEDDKPRIIMVGNNLKRDIVGARRFGIKSVLVSWSPRYDMQPSCIEETPDFIIQSPSELPALVEKINATL